MSQKAATVLVVRFGAASSFYGSFPAISTAAAVLLRTLRGERQGYHVRRGRCYIAYQLARSETSQ